MSATFDKFNTFCISVIGSSRLPRIKQRIKHFNIEMTHWLASTPNTLFDNFHPSMTKLQCACAQSHINLWRYIQALKMPYALILEDDARFDKQWLEKLQTFDHKNWHALFLNTSEPLEKLDTWALAHNQYSTGGYIISQAGVNKLLEIFPQDNCFYVADYMTTRLQQFGQCYTYFVWLIIPEQGESEIGSDSTADYNKTLRCLAKVNYSLDNYI